MIRTIITKDYQDLSRKAANIISAEIILKPECVLGLATGSTPVGTYKKLVEWYQKGDLDFSGVRTVNLDEYQGLTKENKQSYYYFMMDNLFRHVNVDVNKINIPDGTQTDAERECSRYDTVIRNMGGIDLQLLGLGQNGHIGFNEPGDTFISETHLVSLTQCTIDANSRFFGSIDQVPRYSYTMGIGQIMSAKKILVIVSGEEKAPILRRVLKEPVTPLVPASILQFHHDVIIVADEAAASRLN